MIENIRRSKQIRLILTRHDPLKTVANLQQSKTILFDGQAITCDGSHDTAGL